MDFSKGVSSLSELCSDGNIDALLDEVAGSDDISLVSESELSSNKSIIVSSYIRKRSSSLIASLFGSMPSNPSMALFIIQIVFETSSCIFLSGSNRGDIER